MIQPFGEVVRKVGWPRIAYRLAHRLEVRATCPRHILAMCLLLLMVWHKPPCPPQAAAKANGTVMLTVATYDYAEGAMLWYHDIFNKVRQPQTAVPPRHAANQWAYLGFTKQYFTCVLRRAWSPALWWPWTGVRTSTLCTGTYPRC